MEPGTPGFGHKKPLRMVVTIDERSGFCPIQIYGDIDGLPFYHRMRDSVSFQLGDGPNAKSVYDAECKFTVYDHDWSVIDTFENYPGFGSNEEALKSLMWCVFLYRKSLGVLGMDGVEFVYVDEQLPQGDLERLKDGLKNW